MTASKWTDIDTAAIFPQLKETVLTPPDQQFQAIDVYKVSDAQPADGDGSGEPLPNIPDTLAILPLRGLVVYPLTAVPLTVGQPRSVKLVDDAASGQRIIGLVTSKNPDLETPGADDLYRVGTAAIVHRLFRAPDGTIRLLVQGLARFRIVEFSETEPYLRARIELTPETTEELARSRSPDAQYWHPVPAPG